MLRNYFVVSLRSLLRHKVYASVNIIGLATGLTCCILLLLFVQSELSYDHHHERLDEIHLVLHEILREDGSAAVSRGTPGALAPMLRSGYPGVLDAVRLCHMGGTVVRPSGLAGPEDRRSFRVVDPGVLAVFTFPLIAGDSRTALDAPSSILVTEKMTHLYFGDEDPMGQALIIDNGTFERAQFTVTGVLAELPYTSNVRFDFLVSAPPGFWSRQHWSEWRSDVSWADVMTFVVMSPEHGGAEMESRLPEFVMRHVGDAAVNSRFYVQPLDRGHLHSKADYGITEGTGDIVHIRLLATVALLVLVIACANFIILSTARSVRRAREVGVRKAIGGHRWQLACQFFGESSILVATASILALGMAHLALPGFNRLAHTTLTLNLLSSAQFGPYFAVLVLIAALLAGGLPALHQSSFGSVGVLAGTRQDGREGMRWRRGLVVFQFAVSAFVLIGTAVVYAQVDYMVHPATGSDRDHVVSLLVQNLRSELIAAPKAVKEEFLQHPGVRQATILMSAIGDEEFFLKEVTAEGQREAVSMYTLSGDDDLLGVYGIELIAGRNIARPGEYLLNETAVALLGWQDPIGKELIWKEPGPVVGVVKDFHYQSLRERIRPLFVTFCPWPSYLVLRLSREDLPETLAFLRAKYEERVGEKFAYRFLDDQLAFQYRGESSFGRVLSVFGIVAVSVACLGLFGLAASTAEARRKESGIRKVLGATAAQILRTLTAESIGLVCLAHLLVWPVAWYASRRWLEQFAYGIELGWPLFVAPAGLALMVALPALFCHATKIAWENPVLALRHE